MPSSDLSAKGPERSEKTPIFRALAVVLLPVMNVLAKYVVHHPERVPKSGAFVLAPNHYSEIDPIVIGIAMWRLGRMPRFLAKASLFKIPVAGWALRQAGQIPVERVKTRGSDPMAAAGRIAKDGLALVIYPEGSLTRDPDLWPMRGKTGAVRTAIQENIPIIPAAHWGTQLVLPRYSRRISVFPRKTIHITFGEPVDLSRFSGQKLDSKMLAEATEVVMASITALLEELRGESAPAARWDPTKNNQSETGRFD